MIDFVSDFRRKVEKTAFGSWYSDLARVGLRAIVDGPTVTHGPVQRLCYVAQVGECLDPELCGQHCCVEKTRMAGIVLVMFFHLHRDFDHRIDDANRVRGLQG